MKVGTQLRAWLSSAWPAGYTEASPKAAPADSARDGAKSLLLSHSRVVRGNWRILRAGREGGGDAPLRRDDVFSPRRQDAKTRKDEKSLSPEANSMVASLRDFAALREIRWQPIQVLGLPPALFKSFKSNPPSSILNPQSVHSYLSAIIGSTFIARRAGR